METKTILLNQSKEVKLEYSKVNRKITSTDKWKENCDNVNEKVDNNVLMYLQTNNINKLIQSQIQQKINGYRWQDIKKAILDESNFVDYDFVIEILKKSQGKCFYCQQYVQLIYNFVREPKQWTLERIDNSIGHDKGNVEISCLHCNLQRKTMHYEKYLQTKQLKIYKMN